ncbi:hypothetical protein C8R44DRAFT_893611 [Mycena epipterygia]|nr:hypothetical protein C8R44DRAFT_893611 [Mycena epipterygia]
MSHPPQPSGLHGDPPARETPPRICSLAASVPHARVISCTTSDCALSPVRRVSSSTVGSGQRSWPHLKTQVAQLRTLMYHLVDSINQRATRSDTFRLDFRYLLRLVPCAAFLIHPLGSATFLSHPLTSNPFSFAVAPNLTFALLNSPQVLNQIPQRINWQSPRPSLSPVLGPRNLPVAVLLRLIIITSATNHAAHHQRKQAFVLICHSRIFFLPCASLPYTQNFALRVDEYCDASALPHEHQ